MLSAIYFQTVHTQKIYVCALVYTERSTRKKKHDGAVVKNPPANAGDTGSSPGPGISHMPQGN